MDIQYVILCNSITVSTSPVGVSSVTPSSVIATQGDDIIFTAVTSAMGGGISYMWQFSCYDDATSCNSNAEVNIATG